MRAHVEGTYHAHAYLHQQVLAILQCNLGLWLLLSICRTYKNVNGSGRSPVEALNTSAKKVSVAEQTVVKLVTNLEGPYSVE